MRSIQPTDRSTYEGTRISEEDAAHFIVLSFASLSQFERKVVEQKKNRCMDGGDKDARRGT